MMVFANGTESSETNYSVSDEIKNEKSKIIYYRLRTIDNDGNIQFSDIRLIRINNTSVEQIKILTYPNPVVNELRVTIPAIWQNKKVSFEVISVNGQTANKFVTANSSQTEKINVNNLNPGVYIVRVSCEGQVLQQKVIKN